MMVAVTDKKYGAKGDGVTDDTLAIRRALMDPRVSHVEFPPKTYLLATRYPAITDEIKKPGAKDQGEHAVPGNPNEQPYLWINRSNLHVDLGRATLLVEPQWDTTTPPTALATIDILRGREPVTLARWRGTHAAVFLIGYGASVHDVSITGGVIAGYGEKVTWQAADSAAERENMGIPDWAYGRRAGVPGLRVVPGVQGLVVRRMRMKDLYDGVQLAGGKNVTIERCRFSSCHRQAVSLTNAERVLVVDCRAEHCGYVVAQDPSPPWFAMAISGPQRLGAYHVEPSTDQQVHDVVFEHNSARDCEHGFRVQRGGASDPRSVRRITISNNLVHEGHGCGVMLKNVEDWSISHNRLFGGTGGIYVTNKCIGEDPSTGVVERNDCFDAKNGISVIWPNIEERATGEPLHVSVLDNRCGSNDGHGILLSEVRDAVCRGNICRSNGTDGIQSEMGHTGAEYFSDLVMRENTCVGNGGDGISLKKLNRACVTGNVCQLNDGYGLHALECKDTAIFKNRANDNGAGDILVS